MPASRCRSRAASWLLDTYINRPELPPIDGAPDLRRSPISIQELVALGPEAIFLGHGHGDHADNAAYIAKQLNIPIYSTPETCDVMQADVTRLFNDPNVNNGGVRIIPNGRPVTCIPLVTRGSVPGAEVVSVKQLAADRLHRRLQAHSFRHGADGSGLSAHRGQSRSRSAREQPLSAAHRPDAADQRPGGSGTDEFDDESGFGSIPGSPGGPISMFYQFVLNGDNNFTFIWHNTTGPLKEGAGSDPGLPSPAVGAKLFSIMDALPQTDVELGSIVSLGVTTNGVRDPILYQQHIRPQVYIPIHETDATPISSSLRFKIAYQKAVVAANVPVRPEARWIVDPDDFVRPMVFDPQDDRWSKDNDQQRIRQFCH